MSEMQRASAHLRLLEIYSTLLPEQRRDVHELVAKGVPLHTVTSLYPLDWNQMCAAVLLPQPAEFSPSVMLMDKLRRVYYCFEPDLNEVEGGVYGAMGKEFLAELKSTSFAARMNRIMNQLPVGARHASNRSIVEDGLVSVFWYTWSFDNWEKLGDGPGSPKNALLDALEAAAALLEGDLGSGYCKLEVGT